MFMDDALADIAAHARANRLNTLPVGKVPEVIAARLKAFGLDPAQAAKMLEPQKAAAQPVRRAGEFKVAAAKKAAAAVGVRPGEAVPASTPRTPPKGANLKEALAFARNTITPR
jgi:hypothetical protein